MLELRYGLGGEHPRTLDEVGRTFNVTRERIRQIENQSPEEAAVASPRPRSCAKSRRALARGLAALGAAVLIPAGAADAGEQRRGDPVVLSGASLQKLDGVAGGELVGFRYRDGRWKQIPVQLDERKLVDFGSAPGSTRRREPRAPSTAPPDRQRRPQYADPHTFVGADPDAGLDPDDEVALLAADAGVKAGRRVEAPKGTRGRPVGSRSPTRSAGRPASSTCIGRGHARPERRARLRRLRLQPHQRRLPLAPTGAPTAPTPRPRQITTRAYRIGFSDRWFDDALAIKAGDATRVDILDGFKFQFGPTTCGRSEATFNDAEGAFVANIDGPVRAIRSYVGANSGPLTERTDVFWPDRHLIVTDLRVHGGIPGPLTYHDLSAAGVGMTYRDSRNPAGVTVDGVPDSVADGAPDVAYMDRVPGIARSPPTGSSPASQPSCWPQANNWYLDQANTPANVELPMLGRPARLRSGRALGRPTRRPNTDPRLGADGHPARHHHRRGRGARALTAAERRAASPRCSTPARGPTVH